MRILVLGFLIFFAWAALSTHIYVCKIKGFCYMPSNKQILATDYKNAAAQAILIVSENLKQAAMPQNYIIYYVSNKSEFKSNIDFEKYIEELIEYLNENMLARFSIIGYTDSIGTTEYNRALAYQRAQSIQNLLISRGILARRMLLESKGELEPIDYNSTAKGRANNRRTVITFKK